MRGVLAGLMSASVLSACVASSRETADRVKPRSGLYEVRRSQDGSTFRLGLLFRQDGALKAFPETTVLTNRTDLASDHRWQGREARFRLFDPYRKQPEERFYELRFLSEAEFEGTERIRSLGAVDQVVRDVKLRRVADFQLERRDPDRIARLQVRLIREKPVWEVAIRPERDARNLRMEFSRIDQAMAALGKNQVRSVLVALQSVPERPVFPHRTFASDMRKLAQDLARPLSVETLEAP